MRLTQSLGTHQGIVSTVGNSIWFAYLCFGSAELLSPNLLLVQLLGLAYGAANRSHRFSYEERCLFCVLSEV